MEGNNEKSNKSESEEDAANNEPPARVLQLDLGDDLAYNNRNPLPLSNNSRSNQEVAGQQHSAGCSLTNQKKNDNHFSFKHFLNDPPNNGSSGGARPKIKQNDRSHDFPSILPDFVQDHLSYSTDQRCSSSNIDSSLFPSPSKSDVDDTCNLRTSPLRDIGNINIPTERNYPGTLFPFDLTSNSNSASTNQSFRYNASFEIGNSKSLPDFLTDGPVRPQQQQQHLPKSQLHDISHPLSPTAHLSQNQDFYCHNCAALHAQLTIARRRASRLEEGVERNNRRATVAENTIIKLKQELKALKARNRQLYLENEGLRANDNNHHDNPKETTKHLYSSVEPVRLAYELRETADCATLSLKQLLTGMENLRILANDLENDHLHQETKENKCDTAPSSPN